MLRNFLIVFSLFTLVACGGSSPEEKANSEAQSLVSEQNALVGTLNSRGTPSEYWSDEELDKYEQQLDRLEVVENRLAVLDGNNGVIVFNPDNSRYIEARCAALAKARSRKNQALTVAPKPGDDKVKRPPSLVIVPDKGIEQRYKILKNQVLDKNARNFEKRIETSQTLDELQEVQDVLTKFEKAMESHSSDLKSVARRLRFEKGGNASQRKILRELASLYETQADIISLDSVWIIMLKSKITNKRSELKSKGEETSSATEAMKIEDEEAKDEQISGEESKDRQISDEEANGEQIVDEEVESTQEAQDFPSIKSNAQ